MGSVPSWSTHPGESQTDQHVKVRAGALEEAAHCHPETAIPPLPPLPRPILGEENQRQGTAPSFMGLHLFWDLGSVQGARGEIILILVYS